jgi:hypothetical protein
VIPHYPGLISVRGPSTMASFMADLFARMCPTFDHLVDEIETRYPDAVAYFEHTFDLDSSGNQLFFGGWSERRRRCEMYFISNTTDHLVAKDDEAVRGDTYRPAVCEKPSRPRSTCRHCATAIGARIRTATAERC